MTTIYKAKLVASSTAEAGQFVSFTFEVIGSDRVGFAIPILSAQEMQIALPILLAQAQKERAASGAPELDAPGYRTVPLKWRLAETVISHSGPELVLDMTLDNQNRFPVAMSLSDAKALAEEILRAVAQGSPAAHTPRH